MKIDKINFYSYSIPLKSPLNMKGVIQNVRSGFIIEIVDSDGIAGWGEAAPFPGLHAESRDTIERALKKACPELLKQTDNNYRSWLRISDSLFSKIPSLCFAVQSALLMIAAKKKEVLPAKFINPAAIECIKLNALLTSDKLAAHPEEITKQGFQAVKVKVAVKSIDEEINLINSLIDKWGRNIKLRLDANRNWSFEQAVFFARSVKADCIEYIEEPLDNAALCPQFFSETGINYAFDESINDGTFDKSINYNGLKTLIIKPAVVGSFYKLSELLASAHMKKYNSVFSSTFESGVGLNAIANLAAAFAGDSIHGLDTFSWFTNDTLLPPFKTRTSQFCISDFKDCVLDKENLKAVKL